MEVVVPEGWMLATAPVNVRPGKALSVNDAFWPGWILPMSASLIWAWTCGAVTSISVMNALPVELVVVLELEELELVGPPLIHWPDTPFKLATVPLVGATSVAASRLVCACCTAARAFET